VIVRSKHGNASRSIGLQRRTGARATLTDHDDLGIAPRGELRRIRAATAMMRGYQNIDRNRRLGQQPTCTGSFQVPRNQHPLTSIFDEQYEALLIVRSTEVSRRMQHARGHSFAQPKPIIREADSNGRLAMPQRVAHEPYPFLVRTSKMRRNVHFADCKPLGQLWQTVEVIHIRVTHEYGVNTSDS
jgi:hypothetical protein